MKMDIMSKVLAVIFSIITALGTIPKTVPKNVVLDDLKTEDTVVTMDNYALSYKDGRFSVSFKGNTLFSDAVSEVKLDGKTVSSVNYNSVVLETEEVCDNRGEGVKVIATLTAENLPSMKQNFTFYKNTSYFLINTELSVEEGEVATNYIAPVVVRDGKVQNASPRFTNFLKVPFDNDGWAEFETATIMESALSHEVGAFFTPDKRNGFIIGSVNHDIWKSAKKREKLSKKP